jgi:three-Cys-motif partner protein
MDINKKEFDGATLLKLDIFRECFKEWLPVFIHSPFVNKTYIYDFFAGSGMDSKNISGSPLILIEEAKGIDQLYCKNASPNKVVFGFNENIKSKLDELEINVNNFVKDCLRNCGREKCVYDYHFGNFDFKDAIVRPNVEVVLKNSKFGKFILLDQYGFKEVDGNIFLKLVNSPKTDFIFFISSSFIKRFKEHPFIKKYFETEKIHFDEAKPKECHKIVADYFKSLIPSKSEYYLHHFTIKKGSNYYGLIFGSAHSFGMEKFLKVCWEKDKMAGEANFDMFYDFEPGNIFYTEVNTNKIEAFKKTLEKEILTGKIKNNIDGLKFTLKSGIQTKAYLEKIIDLKDKQKSIQISGNFNKKITNIHRIKLDETYNITLNKS